MPSDFIPYGQQCLDASDIEAVLEVLNSDWITQGPKIEAFEAAVSERVDSKYAVAVSTGTAALHTACLSAHIGPGDDVVTTPLTFAASANSARLAGAEVRFADIDADTLCIDPGKLESAITPNTKAIIPVDFAGLPCDMDEINTFAHANDLLVITDAAHSLGAQYKERSVGSLATMTCFSFHPVKAITTGEGGMVTTDDEHLYRILKMVRGHGIARSGFDPELFFQANDESGDVLSPRKQLDPAPWYYEVQTLAPNYRITDIQCALGLSQLSKLDQFVTRRAELATRYAQAFSSCDLLQLQELPAGRRSACHIFVVRLNLNALAVGRRKIFEYLRAAGIGVQVHYIPVHLHPYYRNRYGHARGDFPTAESYYDSALTLPLFPAMTDSDVDRVIDTVLEVVGQNRR